MDEMPDDFIVFKGIEYDTYEAGHFIVIMPDGVDLKVLEYRGMKLRELIKLVHKHGGIIGPAHPCGEPFLSVYSTGKYRQEVMIADIASRTDFLEGFNCGEDAWANEKAVWIGKKYGLPVIAGSDAHWGPCVGLAYTVLDEFPKNNNELIEYFKRIRGNSELCNRIHIWGRPYPGTLKARLGIWNKLLVYGFWPYNKFGAFRFKKLRESVAE